MKPIFVDNSYCGSGKTYDAITVACERVLSDNRKTVIAVPTRRLAKQVIRDAKKRYPHAKREAIISKDRQNKTAGSTIARLTDFLLQQQDGCLLVITHAALQMVEHWARKSEWDLIVDEQIVSEFYRPVRLRRPDTRSTFLNLICSHPANDTYSYLEAIDHGAITDIRDHLYDDEIDEMFAPVTMRMLSGSHWQLYVKTAEMEEFKQAKTNTLHLHGLLNPSLFDGFASVKVMAANLEDTIMYKYWRSIGQKTLKVTGKTPISVGHRVTIKYLPIPKWSKSMRDREVDGCGVGSIYADIAEEAAEKHGGRVMYNTNRDYEDDLDFIGVQLPNVPHGMNNMQDHSVYIMFSALNFPPPHEAFLKMMLGLSEREMRRANIAQVCYQAACRGVIRNPNSDEPMLIIVPDQDIATDLAAMPHFSGCHVEPLITPVELPKINPRPPGRPIFYLDDADRNDARRQQNRLAQQRRRNRQAMSAINANSKSLFADSPMTSNLLPPNPPSSGAILSTWHPDAANPAPAWAEDPNTPKPYRSFLGQRHFSTAEFFAHLRNCATRRFASKKQNQLVIPGAFDLWRDRDHGHSYSNLVGSQGLMIDFDHTDLTPEDIADVLAPYPVAIYSSWSHTQDDWSYRACLPTTTAHDLKATRLIMLMLRDRFERRGYVRPGQQGKCHGIDQQTLNAVRLYYLPCERDHSFFGVWHETNTPIDPRQWIEDASDDLFDSVIPCIDPLAPPQPTPMAMPDQSVELRDRRIQGAIACFMRDGIYRGRGRAKLFGLFKNLTNIGCSHQEAATIMYGVIGHTTNPAERHNEVQKYTGCSA